MTTTKEKTQSTDEKRIAHFDDSILRCEEKLFNLKSVYILFVKNKEWILGLLFILSIIRSSIWYACFGINILTYSSLQDILISFADYFMSIVVISMLAIFIYLFMPQKIDNKWAKYFIYFIIVIVFILLSFIFSSLFRMIFSILTLYILIIAFIYVFSYDSKNTFLYFFSFLLLVLSLIQPLSQYFGLNREVKNYHKKETQNLHISFEEQNAHYDFISFDYYNTHIDTKINLYYLIGSNSNYFFILNKNADETLIIPKNECRNIKSHPFSLNDIL